MTNIEDMPEHVRIEGVALAVAPRESFKEIMLKSDTCVVKVATIHSVEEGQRIKVVGALAGVPGDLTIFAKKVYLTTEGESDD